MKSALFAAFTSLAVAGNLRNQEVGLVEYRRELEVQVVRRPYQEAVEGFSRMVEVLEEMKEEVMMTSDFPRVEVEVAFLVLAHLQENLR